MSPFLYPYAALATVAGLIIYIILAARVGRARRKYGIMAPATTGHLEFERRFRIQYNTVEQLVLFLPALWLCAIIVNDFWAGIGGIFWCLGRIIYAATYQADPRGRFPGFALTALPSLAMMGVSAWILIRNLIITP